VKDIKDVENSEQFLIIVKYRCDNTWLHWGVYESLDKAETNLARNLHHLKINYSEVRIDSYFKNFFLEKKTIRTQYTDTINLLHDNKEWCKLTIDNCKSLNIPLLDNQTVLINSQALLLNNEEMFCYNAKEHFTQKEIDQCDYICEDTIKTLEVINLTKLPQQ